MAEPAASVLEVRDLKTVFRTRGGEIHAVNNVSLHLKPGELLGVVGAEGACVGFVIILAISPRGC